MRDIRRKSTYFAPTNLRYTGSGQISHGDKALLQGSQDYDRHGLVADVAHLDDATDTGYIEEYHNEVDLRESITATDEAAEPLDQRWLLLRVVMLLAILTVMAALVVYWVLPAIDILLNPPPPPPLPPPIRI